MFFFIKETINGDPNAGSKARNDMADILANLGWSNLTLSFTFNEKHLEKSNNIILKVRDNLRLRLEWNRKLQSVNDGDTLLVQFPVLRRPALLYLAFSKVKKRGGRIVLLIHDLEMFRFVQRDDVGFLTKKRIQFEESRILELADRIIVHNHRMKEKLTDLGYDSDKMVELGIFDYLIPKYTETKESTIDGGFSVIIAGTLRPHKTKYLTELPNDVNFDLYGIGYEDQGRDNVVYHGAFPPDDLPNVMKGTFGLVWDGNSAQTCTGYYGEYMRINNPHKTSLYLAAGIPIIIWSEAALAEFVKEHSIGMTVDSLYDLREKIQNLTDYDYSIMVSNTKKIGEKLRSGFYLKSALTACNLK